jgi:hypothetical protein
VWQALAVTDAETGRSRTPFSARLTGAGRRVAGLAARIPVALAVVVALGVVMRLALWAAYDPVVMNVADTAVYTAMAHGLMFDDPARTAGYSMFLAGLDPFTRDLDVILVIQHLIGIATGLLAYATIRRVGAPVWAGVGAAAAVLLTFDQVLVEHTLISEVLFTFVLVAALYAGVRALEEPRALFGPVTTQHMWLVGTGVLIALSAWVRGVSSPLIPAIALFFVLAIPGPVWSRIGRGALAGTAGMAVLLVYFALNSSATGTFGMTQATGWALYSRVAPFADCAQFTAPEGAEDICEQSPIDTRSGPDFYSWSERSPAQRVFGYPPAGDDVLGEFGRRVIVAQPRDYVLTVGRDTIRYFFPELNSEQFRGGSEYSYLEIGRRDHAIERDIQSRLDTFYDDEPLSVDEDLLLTLTDLQEILRVHPILMLQALLLAGIGAWFASGRVRAAIVLLAGVSLLLLVIPSAIGTYNVRYAVPIAGPLVGAGMLGAWVCVERLRRRGRPDPPT